MPLLTLYADASYCPDTGAAGGAYEIVCGDMKMRDRFQMEAISDSWEAEVMTYGRAVQALMRDEQFKKYLHDACTIVATLDCSGVETFVLSAKLYSNKGREFPPSTLSVREMHNLLTTYTGSKVIFEHVKSHTDAETIAAFYNSRVDSNAKKCMLNMRKKLLKG